MTARAWALFAFVSVLWGIPYFFIKIAVEEMPPGLVAWSRVALGAAILLPLAWRSGALRGLRARWRWVVAYAAFEIAIPFSLIPFGEQHISSSLTAILIASVPLAVAVLAIRWAPEERARGRRLLGLFIGLAGVVALVGIDVAGTADELFGAACMLGAVVCYASATLVVQNKLADLNPLGPVTAGLVVASFALLPLAAVSPPSEAPSAGALASVIVLGVACTAMGLFFYFQLVAEAGPSRAAIITYVNPIVAVALGVALLGESLGAVAVAGLLLILAGSWLATGGGIPPGLGAVLAPRRFARRRAAPAGAVEPRDARAGLTAL